MAERGSRKLTATQKARQRTGLDPFDSEGATRQGEVREESTEETSATGARDEAPDAVPSFGLEDETVGDVARERTSRRRAGRGVDPVDQEKLSAPFADKKALGFLFGMIDAIMVARLGPEAKFTKEERDMIETSMIKMLARMSPKSVKTLTSVSDPMMLLGGLIAYAMRLSSLSAKKARQDAATAPVQLRRETPATATFRPSPGPVPGAVRANGVPTVPAQPVATANGTGPRDGLGKVDDSLAASWG